MKIAIFYHLYQVNNWRNILDEQINKVCSSSLYSAIDLFHIGINGNEDLPYSLPKIKTKQNNLQNSEADTLYSLWEYATSNPEAKILYFYNKGVTHFNHDARFYNTNSWRLYLEYFNIIKWKECIHKLKLYDTVGTEFVTESNYWDSKHNWRQESNWHYSGNFWWANASYVKNLDPYYVYSDAENNIRNRCEFWLGTNKPNYYNFYNTNTFCRYGHTYNPIDYMTI